MVFHSVSASLRSSLPFVAPIKSLVEFNRVTLQAGESVDVAFEVVFLCDKLLHSKPAILILSRCVSHLICLDVFFFFKSNIFVCVLIHYPLRFLIKCWLLLMKMAIADFLQVIFFKHIYSIPKLPGTTDVLLLYQLGNHSLVVCEGTQPGASTQEFVVPVSTDAVLVRVPRLPTQTESVAVL
jgi:hypothetical protein